MDALPIGSTVGEGEDNVESLNSATQERVDAEPDSFKIQEPVKRANDVTVATDTTPSFESATAACEMTVDPICASLHRHPGSDSVDDKKENHQSKNDLANESSTETLNPLEVDAAKPVISESFVTSDHNASELQETPVAFQSQSPVIEHVEVALAAEAVSKRRNDTDLDESRGAGPSTSDINNVELTLTPRELAAKKKLEEDIAGLQRLKNKLLEEAAKCTRSEEENDRMMNEYMKKLHEYNAIKDAAQIIFGKIAELKGETIRSVHKSYGIDGDE